MSCKKNKCKSKSGKCGPCSGRSSKKEEKKNIYFGSCGSSCGSKSTAVKNEPDCGYFGRGLRPMTNPYFDYVDFYVMRNGRNQRIVHRCGIEDYYKKMLFDSINFNPSANMEQYYNVIVAYVKGAYEHIIKNGIFYKGLSAENSALLIIRRILKCIIGECDTLKVMKLLEINSTCSRNYAMEDSKEQLGYNSWAYNTAWKNNRSEYGKGNRGGCEVRSFESPLSDINNSYVFSKKEDGNIVSGLEAILSKDKEYIIIEGKAYYLEKVYLGSSYLKIQLINLNLADTNEGVVAEKTMSIGSSSSVDFNLKIDVEKIDPNFSYGLYLTLRTIDGKLQFATEDLIPIDFNHLKPIDIKLKKV